MNIVRWPKATLAFVALVAVAVAIAACAGGNAQTPTSGETVPPDQIVELTREAVAEVQSYRYTLDLTGWGERSGEARRESHWQSAGEWAAPGDFRAEVSIVSEARNGEAPTYQHMRVDERYFQLTPQYEGVWRETGFPQPGGPPSSLVSSQGEWRLVDADARVEGASAYHLRSDWTHDLAGLQEGRVFIASYTHNLYVSHSDMLPVRLEALVETRAVLSGGEVAERGETFYAFDLFDHNTPITIELPEPRVDLPDPNAPTPPHPAPTPPHPAPTPGHTPTPAASEG